MGVLWNLRENSRFTYAAHYDNEAVIRHYRNWALAVGAGAGALLGASIVSESLLPSPTLLKGVIGAAAAVAAGMAIHWMNEADKVHAVALEWHDFYRRATMLRDQLGDGTRSAMTIADYNVLVDGLTKEKAELDRKSPPTVPASYNRVTKDLNGWWYKAEADAHRRFGWDASRVPGP